VRLRIATSNVGDPATNAPTNVTKVFALDPATGKILWTAKPFPGKVFAPVSAVPGVAFVATDQGTMAALATATGRRLWTYTAAAKSASGPSIVDGRVLWGYGFILFGSPGPGGVISFAVRPQPARVVVQRSAGCGGPDRVRPGVSDLTMQSGGVERHYLLDVPASYDGKLPYAILFGLHALTVDYHFVPSMVGFDQGER
jgi:PQQ-like domain